MTESVDDVAGRKRPPSTVLRDAATFTTLRSELGLLDPISVHILRLLVSREQKGLSRYGVTLDDQPDDARFWLRMAMEELADALMYIVKAFGYPGCAATDLNRAGRLNGPDKTKSYEVETVLRLLASLIVQVNPAEYQIIAPGSLLTRVLEDLEPLPICKLEELVGADAVLKEPQ